MREGLRRSRRLRGVRRIMTKNLFKLNFIFVFIFLNIWDYAVNRDFFNGMILGILMFSPAFFLWFIGTVRAAALITLISTLEFLVLSVFLFQGLELSGFKSFMETSFWFPYLVVAGINGFFGLKIYSEYREQKEKQQRINLAIHDS